MKQLILFACALFTTFLSFGQTKIEELKIPLPEEYNWKIGYHEENSEQQYAELVPGKEEFYDWTIIVKTLCLLGMKNVSPGASMNLMYEQAKKDAIDPVLTLVERNDAPKNPWIIFKLEIPRYKKAGTPESQLYYIIQGEKGLYSNFVTIKEKTLSKEFVDKWTKVFKKSKFAYQ